MDQWERDAVEDRLTAMREAAEIHEQRLARMRCRAENVYAAIGARVLEEIERMKLEAK